MGRYGFKSGGNVDNFATRYAQWVTSHRWLVIILTVILVMAAGAGAKRLTMNSDYRVFFKENNPQVLAFDQLQRTYTKNDNVMFVVEPASGDVFTLDTLKAIHWLTDQSWQLPFNIRVDSVTNFQNSRAEGDELIVEDLVLYADELTGDDLPRVRDIALNEPLLVNRLISESGHVSAVNVTMHFRDGNNAEDITKVVTASRDLAAEFEAKFPGHTVHLTGNTLMNNAFREATRNDFRQLFPIMLGIVILMLILMLRSVGGMFATVLTILFSVIAAMGLSGWAGAVLSGPVANAPTIILTMAIADSVHLLVSYFQSMRKGMEKQAAMVESVRLNFMPVFITSLTTVVGFLSMNFSEAPPFHVLGNIVAVGVTVAFILSVVFLPALMMVLPAKIKVADENEVGSPSMDRLADFVIARRTPLLIGMSIIILGVSFFATKNEFNDEFHKYFDETYEFRRATDFTIENLTGVYIVDYSLPAGSNGDINEPDYLKNVEEFADWFRQQPEVIHVNTFTEIMSRLNKNMNQDDEDYYRLPEERDLAAQYVLLYEMSLPYGLDMNNQVDIDKSATRFTVTLKAVSSNEMIDLERRAQAWLDENGRGLLKTAKASGPSLMFAHIGYINARSMLYGTVGALFIISFILIFALRSVKTGIISLLPNLVPASMAFGLWGMFNGEIGMSLAVVAGMTLGIVVDDTVHFLSKYLRARREQGLSADEAVRYAFNTVGVALVVTTVILVAGFMVMATSHFQMNSDMGLMTAITILLALIADFLFLPPLLMFLEKRRA